MKSEKVRIRYTLITAVINIVGLGFGFGSLYSIIGTACSATIDDRK